MGMKFLSEMEIQHCTNKVDWLIDWCLTPNLASTNKGPGYMGFQCSTVTTIRTLLSNMFSLKNQILHAIVKLWFLGSSLYMVYEVTSVWNKILWYDRPMYILHILPHYSLVIISEILKNLHWFYIDIVYIICL